MFHRSLNTSFPLMRQKPPFALDTPTITSKRTIGTDHTMTRHHNPNGIRPVSKANRPDRGRPADLLRKLTVRNR